VVAALVLLLVACGDDDDGAGNVAATSTSGATSAAVVSSATTGAAPATTTATTTGATTPDATAVAFGVGMLSETFTDTTRGTPASQGQPATNERVLDTVVWYPTDGDPAAPAREGAEPAGGGRPFPLVIFSHGFGGDPENIQQVADDWVRGGFVVAAPRFPLSRSDHAGGPDAGDVQNQTGDVSFLITTLTGTLDPGSPLAGLVDGEHVGVTGHSNGAITTLGVTAHTCCADDRIDAAIEMAGTPSPFSGGEYDLSSAPPYLIVHGTKDPLVNYANAVTVFNDLHGPKALITIEGGDHGSYLGSGADTHDDVARITTDFLRAYVTDDADALHRLESEQPTSASVTLKFTAEKGSTETIPTTASPATNRQATAAPTTDLSEGQRVTVTWSGFLPDGTVNVVQCSQGGTSGAGACDLTTGYLLHPDPTGTGTVELPIIVGAVGNGRCEVGVTDCVIILNDSGLSEPAATIRIPLTFAA
jgi:dienelactone hydrolase